MDFLTQPLTTEDGFLNEACMNELESCILNMPPTYTRLKDDKEWNTKRCTYWREITGYLAAWSIRQIAPPDNTPSPSGLENVLGYLSSCIRSQFDKDGYSKLSLCEINKMLHDTLMPLELFGTWNDSKILFGWIDLDALLHNVCISIRNERRMNDEFDRKFDAKNRSDKEISDR